MLLASIGVEGSINVPECPRLYLLMFRNLICFYGEELLAPRPTPKLEDHPLSAVRDCLFNIFAATLHIGGPFSIRNLRTYTFWEIVCIPNIIVSHLGDGRDGN